MRPELKHLIVNARARLGGYQLAGNQAEENARRQAIEDFKTMLVGKLDLNTRLELLLDGEYLWLESAPAVHFTLDGHTFLLAGGDGECQLLEECHGEPFPIVRLALSDPMFEDRLLAAIGSVLDPVRQ